MSHTPSADYDAAREEHVEWAVDGDGYRHERRHRDDAALIVAANPAARTLMRRTVTTITTPWTPASPAAAPTDRTCTDRCVWFSHDHDTPTPPARTEGDR